MGAEWSADNRLDGSKSESKGVAFEKVFVEVCGVPIERGYLRAMEAQGLVPAGTTASARPSRLGTEAGPDAPATRCATERQPIDLYSHPSPGQTITRASIRRCRGDPGSPRR